MMAAVKPYLYAFFIMGGLALLGGIYAKGRLDATHAAERKALEASIKSLEADIERWRKAAEADARQALQDAEAERQTEAAAKEILDDVAEPDSPALDAGTADRLRDFARGQHKARPPAPSKRP